ncbi:MAG: histidine kinase [Actinobacteria bacterium]|nr:histidine kinase [Actinomycetota bacterium]
MTAPPDLGSPRPVGRLGPFFASIWLFFLLDPLAEGWARRAELRGWLGIAATVVFAAVYMTLWVRARADRAQLVEAPPLRWSLSYLGALVLLGTAMVGCLGEPGLASVVYVGVALVMTVPVRVAAPVVLALTFGVVGLGALEDWGSQVGTAFGLVAASVAVFGLRAVMSRNIDLVRAHEQNASLAVENERTRFARDLHDILGHSLTVITVKAELAQRLLDVDPARARAEVADLERLSRDALADVRRAVEGYRELTLPGELTRARMALSAAEIRADLPNATDEVPSDLRELFAWTVREGVTNVVRHSRATTCEVRIGPTAAEVRDDGIGPQHAAGSGLAGLGERAAAVGATVVTTSLDPGFSLRVVRA